jgi:hypothetical protein
MSSISGFAVGLHVGLISICFHAAPAIAQTEAECLRNFAVKDRSVTYIAVDPANRYRVSVNSMSCASAEAFRARLYVSMDKSLYDSEQILRSKLTAAESALSALSSDLESMNDQAAIKARLLAVNVTIQTLAAITTTAACASAVINGAGLGACGAAAATSISTVLAWEDFKAHAGSTAALKSAAQTEIRKQRSSITALSQQLDATKAKNMKENYSQLFVAICRAVQQQCL